MGSDIVEQVRRFYNQYVLALKNGPMRCKYGSFFSMDCQRAVHRAGIASGLFMGLAGTPIAEVSLEQNPTQFV